PRPPRLRQEGGRDRPCPDAALVRAPACADGWPGTGECAQPAPCPAHTVQRAAPAPGSAAPQGIPPHEPTVHIPAVQAPRIDLIRFPSCTIYLCARESRIRLLTGAPGRRTTSKPARPPEASKEAWTRADRDLIRPPAGPRQAAHPGPAHRRTAHTHPAATAVAGPRQNHARRRSTQHAARTR